MKAMQEMHAKMMAAKTPEERNALMADHMKAMRGGMAMMEGMSGMGSMGGMGAASAPPQGMPADYGQAPADDGTAHGHDDDDDGDDDGSPAAAAPRRRRRSDSGPAAWRPACINPPLHHFTPASRWPSPSACYMRCARWHSHGARTVLESHEQPVPRHGLQRHGRPAAVCVAGVPCTALLVL